MRGVMRQGVSQAAIAAIVCCGLLANAIVASAQSEPGAQGWGFRRTPESQAQLDAAREARRALVPVILIADAQSDAVLEEVTLATDGKGRRVVGMKGQLGPNTKDFFWAVDPRTGRYRVFNLGNPAADARRLFAYLGDMLPAQNRALLNVERLRRQLSDLQRRKAARTQELNRRAKERPAPIVGGAVEPWRNAGHDLALPMRVVNASFVEPHASGLNARSAFARRAAAQYPYCNGQGEAAITHYDPIAISLTDTYISSVWYYNGLGGVSATAYGYCWANPETPVGTHWSLDACSGELSSSVSHAFAGTETLASNFDFLDPAQGTFVNDQANVFHTNGSPGWATFSNDWGEASTLIFGVTMLGYAYC